MNVLPESTPAAEILAELRRDGPPALGPGRVKTGPWRERLESLSNAELLGTSRLADPTAAACVRSGLLLFADDLDASHRLSQGIKTRDGSYWHGIMHRREQDYSNSKYWYRQVDDHIIYRDLTETLGTWPTLSEHLGSGRPWDPYKVVDLVAACEYEGREALREELLALQETEMLLLLGFCYRKAVDA